MVSEKSMTQAIMQSAIEASKAAIMIVNGRDPCQHYIISTHNAKKEVV